MNNCYEMVMEEITNSERSDPSILVVMPFNGFLVSFISRKGLVIKFSRISGQFMAQLQ